MKKDKFSRDVKSAEIPNLSVLGYYEGECADANITNKNGLDITRPVWENVFSSDDYKQAISLGWYIGYLGHPEDPNCMDFKDACIVMTEGRIDDNGKVYGKFNLIDTPVGRVVKAFQDAGVQFGISVRGAGDIVDNSVDPDTFIFRGFDLVTFPAYPESIPTFTAIAASTDVEKQAKYKILCSTVSDNLSKIESKSSLDILEKHFAERSPMYEAIQARKYAIDHPEDVKSSEEIEASEDISDSKVEGMMNLYLESIEANRQLEDEIKSLNAIIAQERKDSKRKLERIKVMTSYQVDSLNQQLKKVEASYEACKGANSKLKMSIQAVREENLKYRQSVEAAEKASKERLHTIRQLKSQLSETVTANEKLKLSASNSDAKYDSLKKKLKKTEDALRSYQSAYLAVYANAVGVDYRGMEVTTSTSVEDLQSLIRANAQYPVQSQIFSSEDIEVISDPDGDSDLVTI